MARFRENALVLTILLAAACGQKADKNPDAGADRATLEKAAAANPETPALLETKIVTGASASASVAQIDANRLKAPAPGEWLSYGRTYDEQRHSPLTQINTDNVADLGVAWTYDLATSRGVEATPIVVDGVMYVTSAWSIVYALDPVTGAEKWVYDPKVDRSFAAKACCDVVNRGVAVWGGKVFVGTIDGRLEALNAETGDLIWSAVTVDQSKPYTITGAPRVVKGKVLIGNGGAELGVRGYISAYDADTGDKIWRFYTTPNPEKKPDGAASDDAFARFANDSWGDDGAWKTDGGGGTVWDSIIYDETNDLIIFGVGNGSPWNQTFRDPSRKDNLFVSSIVAVDPETGAYKWHFQTTPGDNWDYTATQSLILADLPIDGQTRRVVMQAPKNGFFYVLDAATGAFISGDNFVPVNWTTGLDETGRPALADQARYGATPSFFQTPGPLGAHNWHPMAFSPRENLAFIPAQEIPHVYAEDAQFADNSSKWNTGADFSAGLPVDVPVAALKALRASIKGRLVAWDPVNQTERWAVEQPNAWNGGILSTAGGLVFQGQLGGTFSAYDAGTGEIKWQTDLKSGGASGPGAYEIDGEQYITITTGWGSAFTLVNGYVYDETVPPALGKVITFKLGGTGVIADVDAPLIDRTPKAEKFGDDAMLQTGNVQYARNCGVCHGGLAISSGVLPDLRWSDITGDPELWRNIVAEGALAGNGMVGFSDVLNADEIEAVRAYVTHRAHMTIE